MIDLDHLKQCIKEVLSAQEFTQWEKDLKEAQDEPCAIENFFRKEAEKPAHKRTNYCMICCPCSRCRNKVRL